MQLDDSIEQDDDVEDKHPGLKERVLEYCVIVKETHTFGDKIDRDDFFAFVGVRIPELPEDLTNVTAGLVREIRDFVLLQTKALSMLKSGLEKDPFDLIVARNISDRILDPTEVEKFAYKACREKEMAACAHLEKRLEVVERYRKAGLLQDEENASQFVLDQARAKRKLSVDAFGRPLP